MSAAALLLLLALGVPPTPGGAMTPPSIPSDDAREWLVPSLRGNTASVSEGARRFLHRLSFSPAVGRLGRRDLYAFRLAYAPDPWLAYEISLAHNPASSVHGVLHTFSAQLRWPLPGRLQLSLIHI